MTEFIISLLVERIHHEVCLRNIQLRRTLNTKKLNLFGPRQYRKGRFSEDERPAQQNQEPLSISSFYFSFCERHGVKLALGCSSCRQTLRETILEGKIARKKTVRVIFCVQSKRNPNFQHKFRFRNRQGRGAHRRSLINKR